MKRLRTYNIQADRVFASPALRTRQTAAILFPQIEPEIVENLTETDFGIFEGKNAEELSGSSEYQAWVDSGCLAAIPGGESVSDFKKRCCEAFYSGMQRVPDGKTAAFVIHGGGIMAILGEFARPKRDFYDYHIGNGAIAEYAYQNLTLKLIKSG